MEIKRLLTTANYTKMNNKKNKFIVIHYTGNNGDTALGNCQYFQSVDRSASAHYFVDENEIYQCVLDSDMAWSVGATTYKHAECRNNNSINIELCSRKDSNGNYYFKDETVKNAIELTKYLAEKYDISKENILRHYDVTGKICPEPFVRDDLAWNEFVESVVNDMTTDDVKQICNDMIYTYVTSKQEDVYNSLQDVPTWAYDTIKKLIDKSVLSGDNTGLNLSYTMCRILVILDRSGCFE